jgi:putative flippase GtrA
MIQPDRLKAHLRANFPRAAAMVEPHFDVLRKAVSFALIGVVNALIDTAVFLLAYRYLKSHDAALRPLDAFAQWCACASPDTLLLLTANITSWIVAVSCSYMMNSCITFAAETGRRLRWRDYGTFVASGILGAVANTTVLVMVARFMPDILDESMRVLAAKACAIVAGFVVNFSMSHFVVFRPGRKTAAEAQGAHEAALRPTDLR